MEETTDTTATTPAEAPVTPAEPAPEPTPAPKPAEKAKPEAKPKTLEQLLKPSNPYERAIANHVRGRHDADLEAAIVKNQRSIGACLSYIAGVARKKVSGGSGFRCVMMTDEEAYGLAVHFFIDGPTDAGTSPGAAIASGEAVVKTNPQPKPSKAKAKEEKPKKEAKPKPARTDDCQLTFGFWEAQP